MSWHSGAKTCKETQGPVLLQKRASSYLTGKQLSRFLYVSLVADYVDYHYQKIGTTLNVTSKHSGQYFAYGYLEAEGVSYKKHGVAMLFQL